MNSNIALCLPDMIIDNYFRTSMRDFMSKLCLQAFSVAQMWPKTSIITGNIGLKKSVWFKKNPKHTVELVQNKKFKHEISSETLGSPLEFKVTFYSSLIFRRHPFCSNPAQYK